MNALRLRRPPRALRQSTLDNLALVPGDLLPYKATWQGVANRLPSKGILIVLPKNNRIQK